MKGLMLKFSALVFVLSMGFSAWGAGEVCLPLEEGQTTIARDPGDAWPWGFEVPFPWKGIQGTWAAELDGCLTYYTFKVVKNNSKENVLQIKQFDPDDCKLISRGAGYEDSRVVTAGMTGRKTGPYNFTVHVFKASDLKLIDDGDSQRTRKLAATPKNVTVMTVSPIGSKERKSHQLFKIDSDPEAFCPLK